MTYNPEFLPKTESADPLARCALFVAFEGMGLLDLTGPLTVFWSASKFMEQRGRHGYARHTVSLDGGPILTAEGVTIETAPIWGHQTIRSNLHDKSAEPRQLEI